MDAARIVALLGLALGIDTAQAANLTVTVRGQDNAAGFVSIAVFDSASAFPRTPQAVATARVRVAQTGVTVTFHGLPVGTYAVSAFHDENGNGKLDTDTVGVPTESYGFSNDARGTLGPPEFAKASFELDAPQKDLTVHLSK